MVPAMRRLAVFAKPPVAGRVKTRLSPALPPGLARDLHVAMLADTLAAAAESRALERVLYWSEAGDWTLPAPPAGFHVRLQHGADLGERLERAFAELLTAPEDRAVIVGADCPRLDTATMDAAFGALEHKGLVLGPTEDGGYYLIGLARPVPELFRGVEWSTPRVFEQTLTRAVRAGLDAHSLERLADLDTPEDLVRLVAAAAAGELPAPRLAEALRAMALLPATG
jgi:rSAM/selenodomain-associated transferase 1